MFHREETAMPSVSRRSAIIASTAGLAAGLIASKTDANALDDTGGDLAARRGAAITLRNSTTGVAFSRPLPHHPTNGDEESLMSPDGKPSYIGNYTKGLPHNQFGEVDPAAYKLLLEALESGDPQLFERIPLGGVAPAELVGGRLRTAAALRPQGTSFYRAHSERARLSADSTQDRLVDPQAALAFDLESVDSHASVMPPPPAFGSKAIIDQIAENYWMALCRDVPFAQYTAPSGVAADAITNLNRFAEFGGPRVGGHVTANTLFRGFGVGELVGPYVSQFLLWAIPFGAYQLPQRVVFSFPGDPVFMITEADWLARQRGVDPGTNPEVNPNPKYIYRGRDLTSFVHIDELFQAYLNAALLLGAPPARGGLGAPHNRGNPYDGYVPGSNPPAVRISTQLGFGTLGEPDIKSVVAEVATRALKAVWYQKWVVHRWLRPEVLAGRIHFHVTKQRIYPFDANELNTLGPTLHAVQAYNAARGGSGSFLPMAFPEGSPLHPSYGSGHATVAGACVTVLKAYYEGSLSFADLKAPVYVTTDDGSPPKNLQDGDFGGYSYADLAPRLTITGELNKLASNIGLGRNFAGVHWRSDYAESILLGERLALEFLRERCNTYNEPVSCFITKFDGSEVVISNV
jgi:hypothetical protein